MEKTFMISDMQSRSTLQYKCEALYVIIFKSFVLYFHLSNARQFFLTFEGRLT